MNTPDLNFEISQLTNWASDNDALVKTFVFEDFTKAIAFIVQISFIAEKLVHHPEIYNVYNKVTIRLSTHDAGNTVTEKDIQLAKQIDNLV
ncbi:MAG: 4a-hydroxytetrahydrobiopterin dehydratase [Bacteroidetes bacterium]|nr:4a-hydroxytetrahydrobiopterin dehydratase [Bacteroidota bacterium]